MTSLLPRIAAFPSRLHFPQRTVRLRLTLLYGALFLVSAAVLLAITYVLVRYTFPNVSSHTSSATELPASSPPGATPNPNAGPPLGRLPSLASLQAQAARQRSADLHQLLVVSGVALVLMALISVVLGWLVAGRVLRPLRTITSTVRDISSTNLHRRLALGGPDDELKELGDTFDGLLGRLERSFQSQRQFVANASHELRTPLTLEQALLEDILTDPDATAESMRATCERVLAVSRQQERLMEALLTLARGEAGLDRWEPFDLAAVVENALLKPRPEIDRLGLQLHTTIAPAPARGDPRLVERLVANLVDNAVRHNMPAGRVRISTGTRSGHAVLSVTNTGPVITPAEVKRLLQPFQRLRTDRTGHGDGLGLGLSIVHAIATAHHSVLVARPRLEGGLEVEVSFLPAGALAEPRRHEAHVPLDDG